MGRRPRNHPHCIELNTRFWLWELAKKYGRAMTLATIPEDEWDMLRDSGFDLVWLMGIWKISATGRNLKAFSADLCQAYSKALPEWQKDDIVGSPFAVANYSVNPMLGSEDDLAQVRHQLHQRGMYLIVDFVPNHVALDHSWVFERPGLFINGTPEDVKKHPGLFFSVSARTNTFWIAHGKDPYFPPWTDTAQLDYANPETRQVMLETLQFLARTSDGVRCDMAMLCLNEVQHQTWSFLASRAGLTMPATEFWSEAISTTREKAPSFIFMAEVYWDREWQLQQLGFDYTYDKKLYDRLRHDNAVSVREHLKADYDYQRHSLRFIEDHDEERALTIFGPDRTRAASVIMLTIPGLRFIHQGQLEGRRTRLPVQLRHPQDDPAEPELSQYLRKCLEIADMSIFHKGRWQLLELVPASPGNESVAHLIAWQWLTASQHIVVIVNWSALRSQGRVLLPQIIFNPEAITIRDVLADRSYQTPGREINEMGLYIDLEPWHSHILDIPGQH